MTKKTHFRGSWFPRDISQERWDNKLPFNSIFIQQYICQKLSTSVDVHWSYSVERHCRFFWDTVYIGTYLYGNCQISNLFLLQSSHRTMTVLTCIKNIRNMGPGFSWTSQKAYGNNSNNTDVLMMSLDKVISKYLLKNKTYYIQVVKHGSDNTK